mgnify:CR=1 FL=1
MPYLGAILGELTAIDSCAHTIYPVPASPRTTETLPSRTRSHSVTSIPINALSHSPSLSPPTVGNACISPHVRELGKPLRSQGRLADDVHGNAGAGIRCSRSMQTSLQLTSSSLSSSRSSLLNVNAMNSPHRSRSNSAPYLAKGASQVPQQFAGEGRERQLVRSTDELTAYSPESEDAVAARRSQGKAGKAGKTGKTETERQVGKEGKTETERQVGKEGKTVEEGKVQEPLLSLSAGVALSQAQSAPVGHPLPKRLSRTVSPTTGLDMYRNSSEAFSSTSSSRRSSRDVGRKPSQSPRANKEKFKPSMQTYFVDVRKIQTIGSVVERYFSRLTEILILKYKNAQHFLCHIVIHVLYWVSEEGCSVHIFPFRHSSYSFSNYPNSDSN